MRNLIVKKLGAKSNGEVDLNNSASKKVEEIVFPKNDEKTKTADSLLPGKERETEKLSEKNKHEGGNPIPGIFGGSLIEELLESDDLCPEEDPGFMKYLEEPSVVELIADLKEVKGLLAGIRS